MKLVGYIKLSRVTSWGPYLLPFSIGAAYACSFYSDLGVVKLMFALISISSSLSFCFALNFYTDRDVDRLHDGLNKDINLKQQPMLINQTPDKKFKYFLMLILLMSLFGFFVNFFFGIIIVLNTIILGILYSWPPFRLKARPVGDIGCNVISGSILMFLAGMNLQDLHIANNFILFASIIFGTLLYLPTVIADYEFDRKAGLNTTAVYFGIKATYRFYKFLLIILLICCLVVLIGDYDIIFKSFAFMLLLILPLIFNLMFKNMFIEYFKRVDFWKYYCKPSFALCAFYTVIAVVRYIV